MGFIKSIFGIVGGLFKAILGVFGVGKKSEFYMELEEGSTETPPAAAAPTATAPAAPVAAAPVKATSETAPSPAPAAKPVAAPVAAQPAKTATPVTSFAANYLTGSTTTSRRRPGPSLSPFKDMAKQVSPR
ncbi:MAG: hypothetical protein ACHWZW_15905 [Spirulina sp.]